MRVSVYVSDRDRELLCAQWYTSGTEMKPDIRRCSSDGMIPVLVRRIHV